jgi:hypothetical protein
VAAGGQPDAALTAPRPAFDPAQKVTYAGKERTRGWLEKYRAGYVEQAFIRAHPLDPDIHDLSMDIVINAKNERAVKAWEAIDGGTKLGLSIGAMIPDGGATRDRKSGSYQIDHVDLLETSLVGVPANPRSWVEYAVKSLNGIVTKDEDESFEEEDPDLTAEEIEDQIEADAEVPEEVTKDAVPDEEPATTEEKLEEILVEEGAEVVTAEGVEGIPPVESVTADIEPTITDATVNIRTPYADVSIDTGNRGPKPANDGTSQEALSSAPENEETDEDEKKPNPWAAIGLSGEPEMEGIDPALFMLEPTVVASLRTSSDLLKAITRELIDTKKALDDAVLERDAAIAATEKVLANTAEILTRLSATPVGRRATVRQASEQFASLKSVYSDDFLSLLKKG